MSVVNNHAEAPAAAAPRQSAAAVVRRLLVTAVVVSIAAVAAMVVHDFSRYVGHYPYLAVDDGLANVSYTLATQGRYGFLSSPIQGHTDIARHQGFFNYGPWYFYFGAALIWLFGYSLALLRSIHLLGILAMGAVAMIWFGRRGVPAAGAIVALGLLDCFAVVQWPMVRPDIAVALFGVAFAVAAGRAIEEDSAAWWFAAATAAGCAAFSHMIAWALVPCCALVLALALAVDRPPLARAARLIAVAALGIFAAALMFYGSFGFRIRDHLSSLLAYGSYMREAGPSTAGYGTVLQTHLGVAFDYLGPTDARLLAAGVGASALLLIAAFWRRAGWQRRALAMLLPPVAALGCYGASLGSYPNYHSGYAILLQVLAWWCAAAAVGVVIVLVRDRWSLVGSVLYAAASVAVIGFAARQLAAHDGTNPRLKTVQEWTSIPEYVSEVLASVPQRARVWGTLAYGVETPDRLQLVQFGEGLMATIKIPEARRAAVVPDYVIWGYPENRDNVIQVLRSVGASGFGLLHSLYPDAGFHPVALVDGPPYGVTRVYAREPDPDRREAGVVVRVYDPATAQWVSATGAAIPLGLRPSTHRVTAHVSYPGLEGAFVADQTAETVLPAGLYLLRLNVRTGAAVVTGRLLMVSPTPDVANALTELGPRLDIAPYQTADHEVYLVTRHPGGALFVGQFDKTEQPAILDGEAWPLHPSVDFRLERRAQAFTPTPALELWAPDAATNVAVTPQPDGWYAVRGNDSAGGYQLVSPAIQVAPHTETTFVIPHKVEQGEVCPGVLSGDTQRWMVPAQAPATELTFNSAAEQAVRLVFANCMNGNAGVPSAFVVGRPMLLQQHERLYTDVLMEAVSNNTNK